jgi:hypothetical protein
MKKLNFLLCCFVSFRIFAQSIPLPEHPRPDFERTEWINLNGEWDFEFDSLNTGESKNWQSGSGVFSKRILVPFPWGSALSGIKDEADIAWYRKQIKIPTEFRKKRIFFTIGASDWHTTVWLNGKLLGSHKGGYTPFSFELSDALSSAELQTLVVKVDDIRRDFTLYGKQGYGNARGIWQTAYLEARGKNYLEAIRFTPDIDQNTVLFEGEFGEILPENENLNIEIDTPNGKISASTIAQKGKNVASFKISIPNAKLWTLENPYLYTVTIKSSHETVKSYFGMRKISVSNLPGTKIPYISLNNQPIYLQLTLDQSYHPEGFYTFPSDEFMKNEIQLCKNIGLNGLRTHIKVDIPRKLYWADKLGLLVMADLPNFWGEPGSEAQSESEYTLRQMIKRDYNHPSIFSWIVFNETWGLRTKVLNEITKKEESKYLSKTQFWVASMYYLAKSLDQTRIVEDNSICCGAGHTETDLNSWHEYLPGYEWEKYMANLDKNTFEGSKFNFEKGFAQGNQPMINSECGNVWGYDGSTGDVDWSYDYHRMMNVFRKYPKMAGWLYTEHHDVINEWNGYWRFDRTMKFTGLNEISPGMTDKDFHSLVYVTTGQDITHTVNANQEVSVPLFVSVMDEIKMVDNVFLLEYSLEGIDNLGNKQKVKEGKINLPFSPWMQKEFEPLKVLMPANDGLYILNLVLKDSKGGSVYHRNFVSFDVRNGKTPENISVLSKNPDEFIASEFSKKTWKALDGLKMNGAGKGHFTYDFKSNSKKAKSGYFLVELSAKELFFKDREGAEIKNTDYMLGARAEPSQNKNSYPMTDETKFSSEVDIFIEGKLMQKVKLEDDPADHRGILSWHYQKQNRKLDEAGSYGYMVKIPLNKSQIAKLNKNGNIEVKLQVSKEGGLAIYGDRFGRYPFNPSIVLNH